MSTEPDYNFEAAVTTPAGPSLHLPFALLTSALAVVMFAQTINAFNTRSALREGKDQLIQGKAQLVDLQRSRETAVKQSEELQKKLQDLVLDLLLLAKTDEDAKTIVTKYNIQQNTPAGGAAPDAATPAP